MERRVMLSAADPDPSFSSDGERTTQVPGSVTGNDVVSLPGGKTLVVGTRGSEELFQGGSFVLVRYTAAGNNDPTFGRGGDDGDGVVTTDFGTVPGETNHTSIARAVAVGADGRITVAGQLVRGIAVEDHVRLTFAMAVARYNANGTPDTTFGPGGSGRVVLENVDRATALALLPSGKTLLLGSRDHGLTLVRLNANGARDATFGPGGADGDGALTHAFGAFEVLEPNGLAVDPDGRPVVVGFGDDPGDALGESGFVARFRSNGSLDPSFGGGDGFVGTSSSLLHGVAVQADRRIVAAGNANNTGFGGDFAVLRFRADGQPDPSFGGGEGATITPRGGLGLGGNARDVALLPGGKIVLGGVWHDVDAAPLPDGSTVEKRFDYFALAQYHPDGRPDTAFNNGSAVRITLVGDDSRGNALAVTEKGKLVVAGSGPGTIVVARYFGAAAIPPGAVVTIDGTAGNDTISISQSGNTLRITRNGSVFTRTTIGVGKLKVRGFDGNDRLFVGLSVRLAALLDGGSGDDTLHCGSGPTDMLGGPGDDAADFSDRTTGRLFILDDRAGDGEVGGPRNHDVRRDIEIVLGGSGGDSIVARDDSVARVLVGNGGDDALFSGGGRNVLVGGNGSDRLIGGAGGELLIDSRTVYDGDVSRLRTLLREWRTSSRTYGERVSRLRAGVGGVSIIAANLPNDAAVDILEGGPGQDWFVSHAGDTLRDRQPNEVATKL